VRPSSLELRGLVKSYGDSRAVDDISLGVRAGEFVTLLGPSGSGKTTTLNAIAGFVELTAGEILMDGKPIAELPPHRRDIGVVFQHYALFPHMDVFDNVVYPLKRRRVPKEQARRRVSAALEMVRLGALVDRRPSQLSGGQQQRVALARALVFNPRALLMDEPLGALDRNLREWLQLEIKRIHQELGITFVYVTHDQDEALVLSDRIAVFNEGRIEQVGPPRELYERPSTLFVGEFLGESNVFPGTLALRNGALAVEGDGYVIRPAATTGDVAHDTACAVLVRPEHLTLRRPGTQESLRADNSLPGTVKQVIYLGSACRIEVTLEAGRDVVVRTSGSAELGVAPGDRVEVEWAAAESVVLRGGPSELPDSVAERTAAAS
jgi:putative spermidine/putrescine transport system ATP-binding protein